MANDASAEGEAIVRDFQVLASDRSAFEQHWQEVAELVLPAYSGMFYSNSMTAPGTKKTALQFDSVATISLKRFASILDSLLTPRTSTWHRTVPSDLNLLKDHSTRVWFEELNRTLTKYRYNPAANFAGQNQMNYISLGAFGSGCMFIDQLAGKPGIRYKSVHLGEIYFKENHQGLVDSAYRRFMLTARQVVQKWGDAAPDKVKEKLEKNPDTPFAFVHCVKPRENYDPGRLDSKNMPLASLYVFEDEKIIIQEDGYTSFPFAISRYEQAPGEVYGRGPAMDVLPAIKTLNAQKKTILKQGHRVVDPVLLAHDDGVLSGFSLKPGAINYGAVSSEGRRLVDVLPTGNLAVGEEMMDSERGVIQDAFLVTLFQILVDSPVMTATEVMERTREKGLLLAPTVGRQLSEYLGPMIDREIDLLVRQGLVPPMPPALLEADGEYVIEYTSPMSKAMRAEEVTGVMRAFDQTLNIVGVTQDPAPLDYFNLDVIVPAIAQIQSVPAEWMQSAEAVEAIRSDRAAQQQQQQVVEALPGAAAMTKAVAQ